MKHPNPQINEYQRQFLEKCNPEIKDFHERLFRVGNATFVYHQKAYSKEIPKQYFNEWLEGLPEPIRTDMEKRGFEGCKTVLSFTRYVNERRDVGMNKWMKEHLSVEDFEYWNNLKSNT